MCHFDTIRVLISSFVGPEGNRYPKKHKSDHFYMYTKANGWKLSRDQNAQLFIMYRRYFKTP